MFKKIAEKFGVTVKTAEEMVKYAMDLILDETADKGKCWVGRNHYFKKIDRKARPFHNIRTGQMDMTQPASYVVYKKQLVETPEVEAEAVQA